MGVIYDMLEQYNDILVVDDLCEILRCGKNTAYKLLQDREIASRIMGGKYIIPKSEVVKFLAQISV